MASSSTAAHLISARMCCRKSTSTAQSPLVSTASPSRQKYQRLPQGWVLELSLSPMQCLRLLRSFLHLDCRWQLLIISVGCVNFNRGLRLGIEYYIYSSCHKILIITVYINTLIVHLLLKLHIIFSYRVTTQQMLEPLIKMGMSLPASTLMPSWSDTEQECRIY